MNSGIELLKNRFKTWSIQVILFSRNFPEKYEFRAIRNQIVRSATSSAANYRAACRAKSGKDFINKLKIVEEELDETMFWIELVTELEKTFSTKSEEIYKEANELLSIVVKSISTARKSNSTNF
jgi:four helix bundle protein